MSSEDSPPPSSSGYNRPSFVAHLFDMPRFHKSLLTLAMLLFGGGLAGQTVGYLSNQSPTPAETRTTDSPAYLTTETTPAAESQQDQSMIQRISPGATKVGLTFIVGFVVGWVCRAFLKMMALVTSLGMALLVGLSYFNVLNIDFTAAEKKYQSAMTWVQDQAERAGKAVLGHIPGSASSVAGMFLGFKRK